MRLLRKLRDGRFACEEFIGRGRYRTLHTEKVISRINQTEWVNFRGPSHE